MTTYQRMHQKAARLYSQSADLGMQVPAVMHKRLSMIAAQDPLNNAKELREIERMVTEKPVAFFESWQAMFTQSLVAQQNLSMLMFKNWLNVVFGKPVLLDQLFYQVNAEAFKVLEQGMYPIHRRVLANAKRLT